VQSGEPTQPPRCGRRVVAVPRSAHENAREDCDETRDRHLVLLCHKRRRFVCRVQQGQRERFRAMATISLRRIVAIEFGM
jgi:hypothetical protein